MEQGGLIISSVLISAQYKRCDVVYAVTPLYEYVKHCLIITKGKRRHPDKGGRDGSASGWNVKGTSAEARLNYEIQLESVKNSLPPSPSGRRILWGFHRGDSFMKKKRMGVEDETLPLFERTTSPCPHI